MRYFVAQIEELKKRFSFDEDLSEKETVSLLAKKFLIEELKNYGYDFDFTMVKDNKGKPFFEKNKKCFFNISHTKDYVAVCFDNLPIGIDIEQIRKNRMPIAERFFHPKEVEYLKQINDSCSKDKKFSNIDLAFTQLWTIKEAYVKMKGEGIANNFKNVNLAPQSFLLNQKFFTNKIEIQTFFFSKESLFLSICEKRKDLLL